MIPVKPRLYLSRRAPLSPPAFAGLPVHERHEFERVEELGTELEGAVVVVTPEEAQTLLARANPDFLLVVRRSSASAPPALLAHPAVAAVLESASGVEAEHAALRSALALARGGGRAAHMLEQVLEIGRALASEKDLDTLLRLILTHARDLTQADGASIYTRDGNGRLAFRLWQNASVGDATGVQNIPVSEQSVAGYVYRSGKVLVLADAYEIPEGSPYRFSPDSDRKLGYRTKSLLTVPLTNKADEVVGVLQLINRKHRPEHLLKSEADVTAQVREFDEQDRALAAALAGQAGVALENSMLYADIERLFEGFIRASVQAIEARDPTTAGHSFRVADFTERLAIAVDRTGEHGLRDVAFTREQLRELRYASLLHDFGKVGVREDVLIKAKKLHPHQLDAIRLRFRLARARLERRAYEQVLAMHDDGVDDVERALRRRDIEKTLITDCTKLDDYLRLVVSSNEPSVSYQTVSGDLERLLGFTFPGESGEALPLLEEYEFANLTLSKGSLNAEERTEIESHVSHTFAFLSLIPWTNALKDLPQIAYSHHEKLDGSGYPRRLAGDDIPLQSRMMTIADIYDALTAGDRPYKRGLPVEKALSILESEAVYGKVDTRLLRVFIDSESWRLAPRV